MTTTMNEAAFRALEREMIELADERHKGQPYSWDRPYTFHLKAVHDNVLRWLPFIPYGVNPNAVILGSWGHDLYEDTETTREEIERRFGQEVDEIIWHVTDEPGKNRKERREATLPKTRRSPGAVFLKLCDRIANIEAGGKTGMYRKEHLEFKAALYKEGEMEPLWEHMEKILKEDRP
jgi:(p)ppGpp synthase/HD superfamily hydrolase